MRKWFNGKKPKPIRNIYAKAESFHRRAPGINFTQINLSIFFIFMCTTKFDERISISVKEGENPSTFIADMANDFAGWHTSKPGKSCQLKHFLLRWRTEVRNSTGLHLMSNSQPINIKPPTL